MKFTVQVDYSVNVQLVKNTVKATLVHEIEINHTEFISPHCERFSRVSVSPFPLVLSLSPTCIAQGASTSDRSVHTFSVLLKLFLLGILQTTFIPSLKFTWPEKAIKIGKKVGKVSQLFLNFQ